MKGHDHLELEDGTKVTIEMSERITVSAGGESECHTSDAVINIDARIENYKNSTMGPMVEYQGHHLPQSN